jgi:hypothetical protein
MRQDGSHPIVGPGLRAFWQHHLRPHETPRHDNSRVFALEERHWTMKTVFLRDVAKQLGSASMRDVGAPCRTQPGQAPEADQEK